MTDQSDDADVIIKMFKKCDLDRNGKISEEELTTLLVELGMESSLASKIISEAATRACAGDRQRIDAEDGQAYQDGSGELGFSEFVHWVFAGSEEAGELQEEFKHELTQKTDDLRAKLETMSVEELKDRAREVGAQDWELEQIGNDAHLDKFDFIRLIMKYESWDGNHRALDPKISAATARVWLLRQLLSVPCQDGTHSCMTVQQDVDHVSSLHQALVKTKLDYDVMMGDEEGMDFEEEAELATEVTTSFDEKATLMKAKISEVYSSILNEVDAAGHNLSTCFPEAIDEILAKADDPLNSGAEGLYVPTASAQEVWVSTWVEAPPCEGPNLVDMIICIDVSGSMTGWLPKVQEVLHALVDRLKARDRLCMIAFNHKARLLTDWTNVTEAGKSDLRAIINAMRTDGGTRFIPAIELLLRQCNLPSAHGTQVVWISDGGSSESYSLITSYLASGLPNHGVALCTLAFGRGAPVELMIQLSAVGRGPYLFIDQANSFAKQLGVLWAWAEETVGEGFLAVRGLGDCRVLEVEEAYGAVPIDGYDNAFLTSLGLLMGGQRRTVAMKVSLPADMSYLRKDLNSPLLEYTFVLKQPRKHSAARRTVRALDVPSLLIEGLTGIPIRISLAEEFAAFNSERQQYLVQGIDKFLDAQDAKNLMRFAVDGVQAGSVIVDGRIILPAVAWQGFVEMLRVESLEDWLSQQGFNVNFVVIAGKSTAQRMLQWKASTLLSKFHRKKCSDLVHEFKNVVLGPAGLLNPSSARSLLNDIEALEKLDCYDDCEEDEWAACACDDDGSWNGIIGGHHAWQLQAAHARNFPADPEKHQSLCIYDRQSLRTAAKVWHESVNSPLPEREESPMLEKKIPEKKIPEKKFPLENPISGFQVVDSGCDWISVCFDGQGVAKGKKNKRVHKVYAVPSLGESEKPVCLVEVQDAAGSLHATLTGLNHGSCYLLSVATELEGPSPRPSLSTAHPIDPKPATRRRSKSPAPRAGSRRPSIAPLEVPDGVKCAPLSACTLSGHMEWKRIDFLHGGPAIRLEWSGWLLGPHWLVTMSRDVALEVECSGVEAPAAEELDAPAKFLLVVEPGCRFDDVSDGIYCVDVKGAEVREGVDICSHGRCWVCIGSYDRQCVEALLRDRCHAMVRRFSDCALVEEDMKPPGVSGNAN